MKSNRIIQEIGAKHTQGCSIRIYVPAMSLVVIQHTSKMDLMRMIQQTSESATKIIFVTSETSE